MPDLIHILMPDQSIRSVEVQTQELTIGRAADNEIVIDHPSVSRTHARLEYDGARYTVTDLDSLNGTFLENVQLAPKTPQVWMPGENLRMGEVWLRLEFAEQAASTRAMPGEPDETPPEEPTKATPTRKSGVPPSGAAGAGAYTGVTLARPDGSPIEPEQIKRSPGKGWVGAYLDRPNLSISPGSSAAVSLLIFNFGSQADTVRLHLSGLPLKWISLSKTEVRLQPERSAEIKLTIRPPRDSESRAGRYRATLRLSSLSDPVEALDMHLGVSVTAFSQFYSALRPEQLPPDGRGQVIIQNQGNLPETFSVSWEDQRNELVFDPPNTKITIPPAQTASANYQTQAAQPHLYGGERQYGFVAHIRSPSGKLESHPGGYSGKALIPAWAPAALAALCVVMTCTLALLYNASTAPQRTATAAARNEQTQLAMETQAVVAALTQTEAALRQTIQGTEAAATATAEWRAADSDGDGLNNGQEVQLFTKPDDPDTDKDGLNDGEEVNTWRTNPLMPDTDGDGLLDGDEARNRNTDPLKRDTDGDGIDDALDPDPLNTPAPSATPTQTSTPTQTLTPTVTPTPTITATSPPANIDLVITITNGRSSSVPGADTIYTILVRNTSAVAVSNVEVASEFPSSLSSITWSCSANLGSSCQEASGVDAIDTLVNLGGLGEATLIVNTTISPDITGLLIASARVTPPSGVTDPNTVNNLAIDSDILEPRVSFEFSKTDLRTTIAPGEPVSYTITLLNEGPSSVSGVSIFDEFPDSIESVSWTCSPTPNSSCTPGSAQVGDVSARANLKPGGSVTISANGMVASGATGVITNTATLRSPVTPQNGVESATDTTEIIPQSDMSLSVQAPSQATVNTQVTFSIRIINIGPSNASSVTLVDQLPVDAIFQSSSPGAPTCTREGNLLTCDLGDLESGEELEVQIAVMAPSLSGSIVNHANVSIDETDPNPVNNAVTKEVQIN